MRDYTKIQFSFDNEDYQVSNEVYVGNFIQLPDGRVLAATMWLESNPPQPSGLHVVDRPENTHIGVAEFQPKDVHFTYDNQEFSVTQRVFGTEFVVLPNQKVLQITDYSFKPVHFDFKEAQIDIEAEKKNRNVIFAEEKTPVKKLKM